MDNFEWFLLITGGFILAWLTSPLFGVVEINVSYIIYIITIISFWLSDDILLRLKLGSSKLVATNFDTTSDGKFWRAGNYCIFTLDDIDKYFHIKGRKGALIVPAESVNKLGRHTVCNVNPKEVSFHQLPLEVQNVIKQLRLPGPYYFGLLSEKQCLIEPDLSRLEEELKVRNELISLLREVSTGKYETVEDLIKVLKRIGEETKEKRWWEKLLGGEEKDKEDD